MSIKKDKSTLTRKLNITIKPQIDDILRSLADKTGLKMATIVEKGILLFNRKENQ